MLNDLKYFKQLKRLFPTARLSPLSLRRHRPDTLSSRAGAFPRGVGERTKLSFALRPGAHPRQSPWVIYPSFFLSCSFPARDGRCGRTAVGLTLCFAFPLVSPTRERSGRASSPQPRGAPAVPGTVGQRGDQAQPPPASLGETALQQEPLSAVKPARSLGAKAGESQRCGAGRGLLPPCPPRFGMAPGCFIPRLCPRGVGGASSNLTADIPTQTSPRGSAPLPSVFSLWNTPRPRSAHPGSCGQRRAPRHD